MKKKKSRGAASGTSKRSVLIDQFSTRDLEIWEIQSADLASYRDRVYFDLERQRAAHYDELCQALREAPATSVSVDDWVRVTDYRWSLTPLSALGSLKGIGGRFNLGMDLDRARGQAFPCLYVARDLETAYREYFGGAPESKRGRLTLSEFALRRPSSFTTFRLHGHVEGVLDLSTHVGLKAFTKLIATFDVTGETKQFGKGHHLEPQRLIATAHELRKRLLCPPAQWRIDPQLFGIPASNQIFGRFARDAGFEAILYSSQQGGTQCMAVFPENFASSDSFVEVVGGLPDGASHTRLDRNHLCLE